MAKKARAGGRAGSRTVALDKLQPSEAMVVLERLIAAHPEFRTEAEQIARSVLGTVSFESVADDVEDAVRQLDLDDLNGRAGRHSWGYTEPGEAAWELLEEAVEPFVDEMKRHLDLGLEAEALQICLGVVLGLYQLHNDTEAEFLSWAPDFPEEAAGNIVADWVKASKPGTTGRGRGRNRAALLRKFVEQHVPEWPWIWDRVAGGKGK